MTTTNDRPDLTSEGAPAIDKTILVNVKPKLISVFPWFSSVASGILWNDSLKETTGSSFHDPFIHRFPHGVIITSTDDTMLIIKILLLCAVCRSTENKLGGGVGNSRPAGRYGDYNCDSPWSLVESAAKAMKSKHGDNIEFVLWTG
jgi:hypothetical protein